MVDFLLPFTLPILLILRCLRATSVSKKVDCQFLFFPISGLPLIPIVAPLWGAAKSESGSESTFAEPGAEAFCFMLFLQRAPHLPLPEKSSLKLPLLSLSFLSPLQEKQEEQEEQENQESHNLTGIKKDTREGI